MSAVVRRKRVYDRPAAGDGVRVLVERLWPRGVSKDAAAIDLWLKAIAPSDGLRRWYAHDAERFDEFRNRYCDELDHNREAVDGLLELAARSPITLVYAARERPGNGAQVLQDYLQRQLRGR